MYAHLLLCAFDDWVDQLTGNALVEYAVICRVEMLASAPHSGAPGSLALAAEISYDRALIKLCTDNGIVADALGFSHPGAERARLEHDLAVAGIDLTDFARRRDP
jgi:hypothetical protein